MSIILKALKKAETSKEKKEKPAAKAFSGIDKKKWGTFLAVISTLVLVLFFVFYLIGPPALKLITGIKKPKPIATVSMPEALPGTKPPAPVSAVGEKKTAEKKPDAAKLHSEAVTNIKLGKNPEAEKILRDALNLKKDDPYLYNHLGLALKRQSQYEDAVSAYRDALKIKPDFPEAMNNLAVALEALGQNTEAEDLYKKSLSLSPSYAEAHLNYALFLEKRGDASQAEDHYRKFLSLSKDEALTNQVRKRIKTQEGTETKVSTRSNAPSKKKVVAPSKKKVVDPSKKGVVDPSEKGGR